MKDLLKNLKGKNYEDGRVLIKKSVEVIQEYSTKDVGLIDNYLMMDNDNWFCYTTDSEGNKGYWAYMIDGDHVTNVK